MMSCAAATLGQVSWIHSVVSQRHGLPRIVNLWWILDARRRAELVPVGFRMCAQPSLQVGCYVGHFQGVSTRALP